jgi:surface polysaccharide O-acyltransferase-like enzyme
MKNLKQENIDAIHPRVYSLEKKNNRIIYFDVLNIIAIISVVALHCNGIVHGNPNIKAWNTSLIVECICYFAVPLFFMLTGATLMNYRKKYDTKTFFKKRIMKVLVPFIFWAVFMFLWKILTKQLEINQFMDIKSWINAFFANREETTYYFMFDILGIYMTIPLLSLLTKEEYRKTLWLTIILFFIFNSFLPNVLGLIGITYNSSLSVRIGDYIVFVLLGYLLSTEYLNKKYVKLIYIGALL